jgi:hypothetical protein
MKKIALLAGVGLAALGSIAPAEAQMYYGRHGWGGGYHGGWNYRRAHRWHGGGALAAGLIGGAVLGGIAAAAASPGYGYGYGYPAYSYGYPAYGYGYAPVVYRTRPVYYQSAYPAYDYAPAYYPSGYYGGYPQKVRGAVGTSGPSNSPPLTYYYR